MDLVLILSSVSILLCLVAVACFIVRLQYNIDRETSLLRQKGRKPMMALTKVSLPFTVEVDRRYYDDKLHNVSIKETLSTLVRAPATCYVTYFCYVAVKELRRVFDSEVLKQTKTLEETLSLLSLHSTEPKKISFSGRDECIKEIFKFSSIPDDINEKLEKLFDSPGADVPLFLPVVALFYIPQEDRVTAPTNETIISLMVAFNPTSSLKSYDIIAQYIETVDHRVYPITKLFQSGVPEENSTPSSSTSESNELCVICHYYPVTRVLMPCRHSCSCKNCFQKLDLCPICRNPVKSFFVTSDESSIPLSEEEEKDSVRTEIESMGLWNFIKSVWNAS